jgi:hypothetical protein
MSNRPRYFVFSQPRSRSGSARRDGDPLSLHQESFVSSQTEESDISNDLPLANYDIERNSVPSLRSRFLEGLDQQHEGRDSPDDLPESSIPLLHLLHALLANETAAPPRIPTGNFNASSNRFTIRRQDTSESGSSTASLDSLLRELDALHVRYRALLTGTQLSPPQEDSLRRNAQPSYALDDFSSDFAHSNYAVSNQVGNPITQSIRQSILGHSQSRDSMESENGNETNILGRQSRASVRSGPSNLSGPAWVDYWLSRSPAARRLERLRALGQLDTLEDQTGYGPEWDMQGARSAKRTRHLDNHGERYSSRLGAEVVSSVSYRRGDKLLFEQHTERGFLSASGAYV